VTTPKRGPVIDVDAHRAARQAKLGPAPVVHVGGRDFELPLELPASVIYAFGAVSTGDLSQIEHGMRELFGENYDTIRELTPAWADQEYLLEAVLVEGYSFTLPESGASAAS
jgi:hypothetical protein